MWGKMYSSLSCSTSKHPNVESMTLQRSAAGFILIELGCYVAAQEHNLHLSKAFKTYF